VDPRLGTTGGGDGARGEPVLSAAAVARMVGGTVAAAHAARAEATLVRRVAPLDRAEADEVSFLASTRYAVLFERTRAGIVLVAPALADADGAPGAVRVVVERPHEALLRLLPALHPSAPRVPGVHPTAIVGRGVVLGADVTVGAYAVLGDGASLSDRAWVDAHAIVGAGVAIGETRASSRT
jgi:UDP-3-O-[3-hydroxymyristoyl] glucosamine N-acyltransferase